MKVPRALVSVKVIFKTNKQFVASSNSNFKRRMRLDNENGSNK